MKPRKDIGEGLAWKASGRNMKSVKPKKWDGLSVLLPEEIY